ncbi:MAG: NAD(P)/FAD-dependent oxidoreductase [Gaiellales bacterium]|jgi:sarcosine oxidase subunit beta
MGDDRASVVIIGGGVVGTSAAFHLAEAGAGDVLLLEHAELGSGSTVRAAGGFRAQFSDELNIAIALRSIAAFEAFAERPGWDINLHQDGYLFLLTDEDDVELFQRNAELQRRNGVPTEWLSPEQARERSPIVSVDDVLGATYCALDGHASPESVVQGYASGARAHGAVIRTGAGVTGIRTAAGRVTGVVTDDGVVKTDTVVCTAGAWSREVAAMAGVELPVTPVLRPVWYTEPVPDLPPELPMTVDFSTGFYFHPEGPGLLFGMADPDQPPGFDQRMRDDWLERVGEVMERRAPAMLEMGVAGGWTGFYEVTPDHNALIGRAEEVEGFVYGTGFSGHGFLQSPAVGEILRDLVLGRAPFVDVAPLSASRFRRAETRRERAIV